jgi:histidinol dehydrogenase
VPLRRLDPTAWLSRRAAVATMDRAVAERVARILEDVRTQGDAAVRRWTRELDGVEPDPVRVDADALRRAWDDLPAALREALAVSVEQVQGVAAAEARRAGPDIPVSRGVATQVVRTPLGRVLVYVPAGRAPLPSSLVMGVVPAQAAGVAQVGVLTPPGPDGRGDPTTLAAAHRLGVEEVWLVGGAQAVAAAAFGTETIPRADKVVGPGNLWVTEAKRQVAGVIGIDGLNGPSEVVVWGEAPASPGQAAADLLAQAEHDPRSWALLISTDAVWLAEAGGEADRLAAGAGRPDLLDQPGVGAALLTDAAAAVAFINALAPEHAELWGGAEGYVDRVTGAGALFVGMPVPLGDYAAGPNHVLPTGGTARFASVLGVDDFVRRRTVTRAGADSGGVAAAAAALAAAEGLEMHRRAALRFGQSLGVSVVGGH